MCKRKIKFFLALYQTKIAVIDKEPLSKRIRTLVISIIFENGNTESEWTDETIVGKRTTRLVART